MLERLRASAASVDRGWLERLRACGVAQVVLVLINWISPSTISSTSLQGQAEIVKDVLSENSKNMGLLLSPMWTYKRGGLWSQEEMIMRLLVKKGVLLDHVFTLLFGEKVDNRDGRPLAFPGRFVFDGNAVPNKELWKNSALLTKGYTEPAVQVAARDMIMIEDLAENALPQTIDETCTVQARQRLGSWHGGGAG